MGSYEKVILLCKNAGISQTALERELGFGKGSIGKMKTSAMTSKRLEQIAEYFGVSMDYLQDRETSYYYDEKTAEIAQEIFENKELQALFDQARQSTPEDLQMVTGILQRLKETNPNG